MADHTVFKVIVPTEATADWLGRWLFAPNPVPANFGRKRRARRARGRRIETKQPWATATGSACSSTPAAQAC